MKTQKINSLRAFIQEHCSLCSCVDIAVEFVPLKMHREKYVDALPATSHHIHNSFVVVVRWVAHFSGLWQGWWLLELNNNAICGGNYCVLKSFGISVRTTRQTAIEWLRTALCCVRSDSQFSIKFSWAKLFLLSYFASMLLFLLQPCKLCDFRCSTPFIVWRTKSKRKTKNNEWQSVKEKILVVLVCWQKMRMRMHFIDGWQCTLHSVRILLPSGLTTKTTHYCAFEEFIFNQRETKKTTKKKITNCNVMECTLLSSAHSGLDRFHFVALRSGHDESCKCRRMQYFSIFIPE